jgi:hypothetical protein
MSIVHELASVKLADQSLVDLARGKVEARQVLVGREARGFDLIGDGPYFTFGSLMPNIFRPRSMTTMAALAGS